jgi:hypothetical protein
VSDPGLRTVARENGALADATYEAEAEALRWNEDSHLSRGEML